MRVTSIGESMNSSMLFGEALLVFVGIAIFLNALLIVFYAYLWVENHNPSLEISLGGRSPGVDLDEPGPGEGF
jgi:hypothetical protein